MKPSDRRKIELLDEIAKASYGLRASEQHVAEARLKLKGSLASLAERKKYFDALHKELLDGNGDLPLIDAAARNEDAKAGQDPEDAGPILKAIDNGVYGDGPAPATDSERLDAALYAVLLSPPYGDHEMASLMGRMTDDEILDCLASRWPRPPAHLSFAADRDGEGFTISGGAWAAICLGADAVVRDGDEPNVLFEDRLALAVRRVLGLDLVVDTMTARKVAWEPDDLDKAVDNLAWRCGLFKSNRASKRPLTDAQIITAIFERAGDLKPTFVAGEQYSAAFGYAMQGRPSPRFWMDPLRNGRDPRAFVQAGDHPDLMGQPLIDALRAALDRDHPRPAEQSAEPRPRKSRTRAKAVAP